MSEVVPPARRRGIGRSPRTTGPVLAPLPRLEVPWSPLEVLTAEQVERILVAAFRVLEEAGLEIRSPAAREVFRRAGAVVDDDDVPVPDPAEQGVAVILSSHMLHLVEELCQRVVIIVGGRKAADGTLAEIAGRLPDFVGDANLEAIFMRAIEENGKA